MSPEEQREVEAMSDVPCGMDPEYMDECFERIGEACNLPADNVKDIIHDAILKLRWELSSGPLGECDIEDYEASLTFPTGGAVNDSLSEVLTFELEKQGSKS